MARGEFLSRSAACSRGGVSLYGVFRRDVDSRVVSLGHGISGQ